jgi:thiamine pyrophosphate-dependent acetolactate synthase large subunit-like protein
MENEPPEWPQGEHYAYHTLSLGFYEGELIRRVDPAGRSLGTVLAEDLTGPLGAEVHVRVPEDLPDDRYDTSDDRSEDGGQALKDQGVDTVFGYPGGAVLPIYDEIFQQNDIRHILVRHEQGAVHAAEGYARATGKPGVVLVTSGPGATNAVTGLTDALMDSIPIVVLTGQVPTFMIGSDAFQEADTVGITRPCTKHNWLVKDTDRSCPARSTRRSTSPPPAAPARCWSTSQGRAVRHRRLPPKNPRPDRPLPAAREGRHRHDHRAGRAMETAERPVFYTGGGVINSGPAAPASSCANWSRPPAFRSPRR